MFHLGYDVQAVKDVLLRGHKQAFVWMDEWHGEYRGGQGVLVQTLDTDLAFVELWTWFARVLS